MQQWIYILNIDTSQTPVCVPDPPPPQEAVTSGDGGGTAVPLCVIYSFSYMYCLGVEIFQIYINIKLALPLAL